MFLAPQAVDNERFSEPSNPRSVAALRARLNLGDRPTLTFVGRLEDDKGVTDLLRASAVVDLPHLLVVAGRGSLSATLRELAKSLRIDDQVRFVGHLDEPELLDLLHASDLLVLPSRTTKRQREPWGMVVNEAMNCALPVVVTDAVGAAAGGLVINEQTGLVVPEHDPPALALALADLIRNDSKRRRLGATAREHVLKWNHASAATAFESALAVAKKRRGRRARPSGT